MSKNQAIEVVTLTHILGKTFYGVETKNPNRDHNDTEELKELFFLSDNHVFVMNHDQDCCEHVYIEDICGDLNDLIGSPILMAEEVSTKMSIKKIKKMKNLKPKLKFGTGIEVAEAEENSDSFTWTFYKFSTKKGSVTIRWLGTSNGYYSERVSCVPLDHEAATKIKHDFEKQLASKQMETMNNVVDTTVTKKKRMVKKL